jgi:hypothetical protein
MNQITYVLEKQGDTDEQGYQNRHNLGCDAYLEGTTWGDRDKTDMAEAGERNAWDWAALLSINTVFLKENARIVMAVRTKKRIKIT